MLGDKLKELRLKRGLTQEQIAIELNITQQTYSRYETGRDPDIHTLKLLAEYFNVSTDFLLDINSPTVSKAQLTIFIQKIENDIAELKNFIK